MGKYLELLDNGGDARAIILELENQCLEWEKVSDSLIKAILDCNDISLKYKVLDIIENYDK